MMNLKVDFEAMAERYRPYLFSNALSFTRNEDDANDLVQDTLLKALRFYDSFKKGTNIKGWLFMIMRNTFINTYRRIKRVRDVMMTVEEIPQSVLLHSATRNSSENEWLKKDLEKALNSLPEAYKYPFVRYFEGYKYYEIAIELNLPLGTVKTHIHQARILLKKYLKTYTHLHDGRSY